MAWFGRRLAQGQSAIGSAEVPEREARAADLPRHSCAAAEAMIDVSTKAVQDIMCKEDEQYDR